MTNFQKNFTWVQFKFDQILINGTLNQLKMNDAFLWMKLLCKSITNDVPGEFSTNGTPSSTLQIAKSIGVDHRTFLKSFPKLIEFGFLNKKNDLFFIPSEKISLFINNFVDNSVDNNSDIVDKEEIEQIVNVDNSVDNVDNKNMNRQSFAKRLQKGCKNAKENDRKLRKKPPIDKIINKKNIIKKDFPPIEINTQFLEIACKHDVSPKEAYFLFRNHHVKRKIIRKDWFKAFDIWCFKAKSFKNKKNKNNSKVAA